jgi:hypothetical protein
MRDSRRSRTLGPIPGTFSRSDGVRKGRLRRGSPRCGGDGGADPRERSSSARWRCSPGCDRHRRSGLTAGRPASCAPPIAAAAPRRDQRRRGRWRGRERHQRRDPREHRRADPRHRIQVGERAEWAVRLAVRHDPRRERRPHARETLQLDRRGALGSIRSPSASGAVRIRSSSARSRAASTGAGRRAGAREGIVHARQVGRRSSAPRPRPRGGARHTQCEPLLRRDLQHRSPSAVHQLRDHLPTICRVAALVFSGTSCGVCQKRFPVRTRSR